MAAGTTMTPRKPTSTAIHRRQPTVSCSMTADRTAMIKGDEKVMVVTLASDVSAIADTKHTRSTAEAIALRR